MYNFIELPKEVVRPLLKLCKNDLHRTEIGILKDAYEVKQKITIGNISELSFLLPYYKGIRGVLSRSKIIDKVANRRIIKFTKGNYTEYYIIHKITDVMDDDKDYKQVECYSLGYELSDKLIKDYKVISYNAKQALDDILSETIWRTDYIDSEFLIKFRAFDISSATVLDVAQQIAIAFDAVIVYDTVNRKINFYKLDNIGYNKGLKVKYGKLLKNITQESITSEYCTRLKAFGKNGLSIKSINATGANYIESYASILTGFQQDEHGNIISHAQDISDSLAIALIRYNNLVNSKQGEFKGYLDQKINLQKQLTAEQNTLSTLQNELAIIEDNLSIANAEGRSTSELITQKNNKISQISNQQSAINNVQASISAVDGKINALVNALKVENNFTSKQLEEWNPHIIVKEWTNDNYTDAQELYDAAVEEFNKRQEPKLVINISIVNLLEIITEYRNWDKLNLGDTITIEHEVLGINVQAKIIEVDFDYENGEIGLTISNVRELLSDEERFIRDMYRSITSSTTYTNDKFKYDDAYVKSSEIYQDIQGTWDANKREIIASNNESVEISRKGIRIYDPTDPNKVLIAQHGIMAISADGGNNWKTAIRYDGIVAEQIKGVFSEFVTLYADQIKVNPSSGIKIPDEIINSSAYWNSVEGKANSYTNTINTGIRNDLRLSAPLPTSIVMNAAGITAFTSDPNVYARLDYRGLYVKNGAIQIDGGLTDGNIASSGIWNDGTNKANNSVQLGGLYNGVRIDTTNGLVVTRSDNVIQTIVNATEGFKIKKNGSDVFFADTGGNLNLRGIITADDFKLRNGQSIVTSDGNKISKSYIEKLTANEIDVNTLYVGNGGIRLDSSAIIQWNSIANIPNGIYNPSYITSTKITSTTIESPTIIGGYIRSNTDIDVERDVNIGNYIRLRNVSGGNQGIIFAGNGSITFTPTGRIEFSAANGINFLAGASFNQMPTVNSYPLVTKDYVDNKTFVAKFS